MTRFALVHSGHDPFAERALSDVARTLEARGCEAIMYDTVQNAVEHRTADPSHIILWNDAALLAEARSSARAADQDTTLIACDKGWLDHDATLTFHTATQEEPSFATDARRGMLTAGQARLLDVARERFRVSTLGATPSPVEPRSIFMPLPSLEGGAPFDHLQDHVDALSDWLPNSHALTILVPPDAALSDGLPRATHPDVRLLKNVSPDRLFARSETVIAFDEANLTKAAMLGRRALSMGRTSLDGSAIVTPLIMGDDATAALTSPIDEERRDADLFEILFHRSVSLTRLKHRDFDHLASCAPFDTILSGAQARTPTRRNAEHMKKGAAMISVGKSRIARSAVLDVEQGGEIVVGDDSEIRHNAVLEVSGRYNGCIRIGNHSVIGVGSWLQGSGNIDIGDDVIIGPYASIVSTNHQYADASVPVARQPLDTGPITIADDVWLGAHVTIAYGVTIGAHSIIGANAFVNSDIPPYSVAVGSPARVIRKRR